MQRPTRAWTIAVTWLALDQGTKALAVAALDSPVPIITGFLRLSLSHNPGALFGMMADWPASARLVLLTLMPLAAIALIAMLLARTRPEDRLARAGLALILGGAAGNVLDRVFRGHVIDFIDVYWAHEPLASRLIELFGTNRWPTFNVADSGLTIGAALLLIEILRRRAADGTERASLSD